jgi:hypothetical protein
MDQSWGGIVRNLAAAAGVGGGEGGGAEKKGEGEKSSKRKEEKKAGSFRSWFRELENHARILSARAINLEDTRKRRSNERARRRNG